MEKQTSSEGLPVIVLERLPLAALILDQDGVIRQWNADAQSLFGWTAREAIGHYWRMLMPPPPREEPQHAQTALGAGDPTGHGIEENVTKGGHTVVCEWWHTPLPDEAGRVAGCLSLAREIARPERLPEKTRVDDPMGARTAPPESEGLAAGGRTAAQIAHDINNPLAGIRGAFSLIKDAVPEHHPYFHYVGRIDQEIDRLVGIVRRISHLPSPDRGPAHAYGVEEHQA